VGARRRDSRWNRAHEADAANLTVVHNRSGEARLHPLQSAGARAKQRVVARALEAVVDSDLDKKYDDIHTRNLDPNRCGSKYGLNKRNNPCLLTRKMNVLNIPLDQKM
jgi:hypothetical protein